MPSERKKSVDRKREYSSHRSRVDSGRGDYSRHHRRRSPSSDRRHPHKMARFQHPYKYNPKYGISPIRHSSSKHSPDHRSPNRRSSNRHSPIHREKNRRHSDYEQHSRNKLKAHHSDIHCSSRKRKDSMKSSNSDSRSSSRSSSSSSTNSSSSSIIELRCNNLKLGSILPKRSTADKSEIKAAPIQVQIKPEIISSLDEQENLEIQIKQEVMEELGESSAMQLCGEEASTTSVFSQPINVEVDLGDIPLPDEVLNPEREKIRLTFGASKPESPNDALPQTSAPVLKKPALPLPSCTPSITILNRHPLPKVDYDWGIGHFRNYKTECIVGEGTYGKVYKALCLKTKTYVALKKIRRDDRDGFPITAIREIKILRQLDHKNIVKLQNVITDNYLKDGKNRDLGNFYLVFEYVDHDLCGLLEGGNVIFSDEQLAAIFKQLLLGLEYCHKLNFLHRDIKCPNILVNKKGQVKLADFGLSRLYSTEHERLYTNRVVTLWYRPPELLLGEEKYGPAIDIWSVGCILGELYLRTPIFRGNNENEQLELIYQTCGTPDTQNWSDFKEPWCTYFKKLSYPRKIGDRFSFIPPLPLDLLDKLLQLNPSKRPSATLALAHDWLENVDPEKVPPPILSTNQDCHELWVKKQRQAHTKEIVPASSDHPVRVKRSN